MLCKHHYPSYMETYLQLKAEAGRNADYSKISNDAILNAYGIILPEHLTGRDDDDNQAREESKEGAEDNN